VLSRQGHHRDLGGHDSGDALEFGRCTGVRGVLQPGDRPVVILLPHGADKQGDTARGGTGDGSQAFIDRERSVPHLRPDSYRAGVRTADLDHAGTVPAVPPGILPLAHSSPTSPGAEIPGGAADTFETMSGGPFPFGFGGGASGGAGGGPGGGSGDDPFGFGGGNFFGELAKLLSWQGGPVNWNMARQVAEQSAGGADRAVTDEERSAVQEAGRLADHWLDEATTLPGVGGEVAAWTRMQWMQETLPVWQTLADPIAGKVVDAMGSALAGGLSSLPELPGLEGQLPEGFDLSQMMGAGGPFMGMLRQIGGLLFGAQVGSALAALAQEVVSPTDVGLPLGPAALLPLNVAAAGEGLEVPEDQLRLYLTLRELAHQRLFAHVPWLKAHLLNAVEAYARGITVDPDAISRAVSNIDPSMLDPTKLDPESLADALGADVFQTENSPEQTAALARLEIMLALVEGWVDETTDAAAHDRLPSAAALRETIRRRRATGGPAEQTFAALVGLELRPRRLREAAALWRALLEERGIDGRDAVWGHPDLMPSSADLDDPVGFARASASEADLDPIAELQKLADRPDDRPRREADNDTGTGTGTGTTGAPGDPDEPNGPA
jgi:putative hydrolase